MKRITFLPGCKPGLLWAVALMVLAFLSQIAMAAVPQLINFQGILRDGSGNPVVNGNYSVRFRIYDDPTVGNVLWSESTSVSTNNGLFTVLLGAVIPVPDTAFNNPDRWLGIKVGGDAEMAPRQKLTSVGYTFRTEQWTSAGQDLFRTTGNVGIGTGPSPGYKLWVYNDGSSPFQLRGVIGEANNSSFGEADGGYFSGSSSFGTSRGVYATGGFEGVFASGGITGVTGNGGTDGVNAIGGTFGVEATGGTYGVSAVGGTFGVYGRSTGAAAVYGDIGGNLGTYGGYFQGDVKVERNLVVVGTVFKGALAFKIDHPLDPSNKYLHHSGVESPDMMNIYNGNVTLDSKGEAVIALPDWFGALNKDFRYQLTAIGAPGPNLYIAQKVSNNQFRIAGGTAGMEVSWQVTGIRQDAYANAHRIPVEEMKADKERGYYLHPDLFGQPEEKGVEWVRHPEMMKEMKERRLQAEKEKK